MVLLPEKGCLCSYLLLYPGGYTDGEVILMDKDILVVYADARARIKLVREQTEKKRRRLEKLEQKGVRVSDSVSCGKRGKKPLGTVRITGYPVPEHDRAKREYEKQYGNLMREEQELLELQTQVEEYITGLDDIEIRNIMTLYYVEDMTWIQVAHGMNRIYQSRSRCYTDSSCRQKHDRFLDKF
ncbi:hypothetical protein ACG0Z4_29685 [Enterocloster aldenensis]|uniref:hypothetical protein n=1 Tax=Enterocloster aldenensis TaxID=358742 RepID=UPI004026AC97